MRPFPASAIFMARRMPERRCTASISVRYWVRRSVISERGHGEGAWKVGGREGVRDSAVVGFGAVDEFDDSVDEVAEFGEEFGIVAIDEGLPFELRITCFRSVFHEIVAPDICWHAGVLCVVAEDANAAGLAELAVLVIEIFGG